MGALQIALLAAQIFGTVEPIVAPFVIAGVKALVNELTAKKAAGVKMTYGEVHALAATHGVNMNDVYRTAGTIGAVGLVGAALALRAIRKK